MKRAVLDHLSYANVMATIAVFVALGGTSYALARNSVGARELQPNSVGPSELRRSAVKSAQVDDRAIRLRDIAVGTRKALRGQRGPQGPPGASGVTFFAAVNSGGGTPVESPGTTMDATTPGTRIIGFGRSLDACVATATPAAVPGGAVPTPPPNGHVTLDRTADGRVIVRMFDPNGASTDLPFNLIVAC